MFSYIYNPQGRPCPVVARESLLPAATFLLQRKNFAFEWVLDFGPVLLQDGRGRLQPAMRRRRDR